MAYAPALNGQFNGNKRFQNGSFAPTVAMLLYQKGSIRGAALILYYIVKQKWGTQFWEFAARHWLQAETEIGAAQGCCRPFCKS
jgi:hypothetical protein